MFQKGRIIAMVYKESGCESESERDEGKKQNARGRSLDLDEAGAWARGRPYSRTLAGSEVPSIHQML